VYVITIFENFSRSILSSTISATQTQWDYLSVLVDAIRRYGAPEAIVTDGGGQFYSTVALELYEMLGIRKERIDPGEPWQNYAETLLYVIWNLNGTENCQITCIMWIWKDQRGGQFHIINAQRRLADWHFERAQTWEDLLAAHEKWLLDFNYQHHFAHEQREDGCHSPAAVLGWIKGMQPQPDLVYRVFSAISETRTLSKAGYAKFRNFLLYGEQGLAGKKTQINIFQDILTLEYSDAPLSRYSVEWQPDDKHLLRVGNPRLYDHPYQSPQIPLWEPGEVEWPVILRCDPPGPRRKRMGRIFVIQPPLLLEGEGTQGG